MCFEGWENWETWNVALYMDNDEGAYRYRKSLYSVGSWDADRVKDCVLELYPDGTPDFDSTNSYNKVNWQEITDAWNEE